ncbi:MAG: type II toxin-antitoxin system VapB family antitoxin [Phycisphaeraceae bacterium JB051]
MATNLAIDDSLILEAVRIGKHKTKKEAVTTALTTYIQHLKQMEMISLFGQVDIDPKYNYKKGRNR